METSLNEIIPNLDGKRLSVVLVICSVINSDGDENVGTLDVNNGKISANGNDIDIAKLESLRLELSQYELEKCRGAVLRSKAVWAVESDKNTKYFLNLEKYKQENNSVKELLNVNNESVNDINGILGLQYDFYKELYTCVDTDDIKMNELLDCVDVKIDENGHQLCESDISFDEIIKALSQMSKNKSPGSDGLTVEFYCHFILSLTCRRYNFSVCNKQSISEVFKVFDLYSRATGAKINRQKSEILCVGKGELSPVEKQEYGLQVCDNNVQLLGIYVGKNRNICDDLNWKEKISKLKSLLNIWLQRQLTLQESEIVLKDKPILWYDFINAGIVSLKDICYEVKTGFLPDCAIVEIIQNVFENSNVKNVTDRYHCLICAIPDDWKQTVQSELHYRNAKRTIDISVIINHVPFELPLCTVKSCIIVY
ncbi:unnamed protein product [Mytilus coruscus]|uniref:Reverse transcriptase domain-containing protein n=1 Tax=Mytilus coruscus TaxID=42192 RepID=A0A6J8EBA5_MYTCO|nr:unnamed protein product [Mytilus coruscus]